MPPISKCIIFLRYMAAPNGERDARDSVPYKLGHKKDTTHAV